MGTAADVNLQDLREVLAKNLANCCDKCGVLLQQNVTGVHVVEEGKFCNRCYYDLVGEALFKMYHGSTAESNPPEVATTDSTHHND